MTQSKVVKRQIKGNSNKRRFIKWVLLLLQYDDAIHRIERRRWKHYAKNFRKK
jgi:hypothetical protein